MAWNAETYNKFKSERFAPFYDLASLIKIKNGLSVIDLGCGTGELTRKLADLLPGSKVLGIDSSADMLKDSKQFTTDRVRFECRSIADQLNEDAGWDVVFSNAALQWVDAHEKLFSKIISGIRPNGQLVVQMPAQHHNVSNKMLNELADESPFKTALKDWKRIPPLLDIEEYARILHENGGADISVFEKIYPMTLQDSRALYDWVSGTALIPYAERLEDKIRQQFISRYQELLQIKFQKTPVFYPFKRILIAATF